MTNIRGVLEQFVGGAAIAQAEPPVQAEPAEPVAWTDEDLLSLWDKTIRTARISDAEHLRAFLSAASTPAAPAPEWQPIGTAPKDGTQILAILPDSDSQYVIEWADESKGIRIEAGNGIGWHLGWDGYFFGPHEQPTHWMYLPAAPDRIEAEVKP